MKLIFAVVTLSIMFLIIHGKTFKTCEIVTELEKLVEVNEIYKHLCIIIYVNPALNTTAQHDTLLGLYKIDNRWWCKESLPGGSCNILCSNLLNDDITDDVECAKTVLLNLGLEEGWRLNENRCLKYKPEVEKCFFQTSSTLKSSTKTTSRSTQLTTQTSTTLKTTDLPQKVAENQNDKEVFCSISCLSRPKNIALIALLCFVLLLLLVFFVKCTIIINFFRT